jgi:putative restriction endonuclease
MRYWWVNQNQTFEQETRGGYMWSPKRKANDQRNPFYEFMREVAPGDVVFSFQGTYIRGIGIAQSYCYECPKPAEFGSAGPNWSNVGWKVDVRYTPVPTPVRPADHMAVLRPLLADKYAPLRPNGHGLQSVYLTSLEPLFAEAVLTLLGPEGLRVFRVLRVLACFVYLETSPRALSAGYLCRLVSILRPTAASISTPSLSASRTR